MREERTIINYECLIAHKVHFTPPPLKLPVLTRILK